MGEIKTLHDFNKLRDSFSVSPNSINKFLSEEVTVDGLFYETKAKGAFAARNANQRAENLVVHLNTVIESGTGHLLNKESFKSLKDTLWAHKPWS